MRLLDCLLHSPLACVGVRHVSDCELVACIGLDRLMKSRMIECMEVDRLKVISTWIAVAASIMHFDI